jgi:hypothetical protein
VSGFFYVATPFSLYSGGHEAAWRMACRVTAELLRAGVPAFSPIAHSYPVALHGGIEQTDLAFWLGADRPMMDAAKSLIVVQAAGYIESRGVQAEIAVFVAAGKPVHFMRFDPLVVPQDVLP